MIRRHLIMCGEIQSTVSTVSAVLDRQAHAVQQDAVQRPGIGGELPETMVLEQCLGDAEIGEQFARLPIEIVERHLVCPRIFNSKHFFMCKTSLILIFG